MKNVEALKALYEALGGSAADVANASTSVDVLNAIAAKYEGAADADLNPEAIANIAAVAGNIGGGGSSDLSTATVTVVLSDPNASGQFYGAVVDEHENFMNYSCYMDGSPFKVALYNGSALASIEATVDSVSGNIEDRGRDGYIITGDCTITISLGEGNI